MPEVLFSVLNPFQKTCDDGDAFDQVETWHLADREARALCTGLRKHFWLHAKLEVERAEIILSLEDHLEPLFFRGIGSDQLFPSSHTI